MMDELHGRAGELKAKDADLLASAVFCDAGHRGRNLFRGQGEAGKTATDI